MDGDDQLPGGEQDDAHQQDAANHGEQDHEGVRTPAALGFLQGGEDGASTGVLRVRELHHTVRVGLKETEDGSGVVSVQCLHGDDVVFTQTLTRRVVGESSRVEESTLDTLSLGAAGVGAGGALLAGVPKRPRFAALAPPAHAVAPPTARLAGVRQAGRRVGGAVAVVSHEAGVTLALPAVTLPVT